MKSVVPNTGISQLLKRRGLCGTTEEAGLPEAHIVQHDQHHIGSAIRRRFHFELTGCRVFIGLANLPVEGSIWQRQILSGLCHFGTSFRRRTAPFQTADQDINSLSDS